MTLWDKVCNRTEQFFNAKLAKFFGISCNGTRFGCDCDGFSLTDGFDATAFAGRPLVRFSIVAFLARHRGKMPKRTLTGPQKWICGKYKRQLFNCLHSYRCIVNVSAQWLMCDASQRKENEIWKHEFGVKLVLRHFICLTCGEYESNCVLLYTVMYGTECAIIRDLTTNRFILYSIGCWIINRRISVLFVGRSSFHYIFSI